MNNDYYMYKSFKGLKMIFNVVVILSYYKTIKPLESNFTWISLSQKNKKTYKRIKEKKHSNYY